MNIQVASDFHIECFEHVNVSDFVNPSADVLILSGDIGSLYKFEQLIDFLKKLSTMYKKIIYVPGKLINIVVN